MARDRQRSKARQRARAAGQKPRGKKARAQDEDLQVDETGLTEDPAVPGPMQHAFPYVEDAKAAEARGAEDETAEDEEFDFGEDLERGEDEVEIPPDLVGAGGGGRRGGGLETLEGEEHHPDRKQRGRVLTFLRACIDELGRVQWPDRKHVFQATAVVLGFCLIAGGFLGLMDAIWQPLINSIL